MTQRLSRVVVDRTSPVPLYFQICQYLAQLIESGTYPPGTRLDTEVVLADRLGVSRPTVRRALECLVDCGLLVRRRGVGTQVVQPTVRLAEPCGFHDVHIAGEKPGR